MCVEKIFRKRKRKGVVEYFVNSLIIGYRKVTFQSGNILRCGK